MRASLSFVIVSLWLAHCGAKPYDGDFCTEVIDFAINDATDTAALDASAKDSYSFFPRWIAEECLAAAWKFSCMYEYGKMADDGSGYCRDACVATLDSCQDTIKLLGEEGAGYVAAINVLCSSPSDTSTSTTCHTGGHVSYADVPSGFGAVCPKPLGRATPKEGTSVQSISGTACALPCPPIVFTHNEWFTVRGIMKWCSFASFALSLVVVLAHPEQKNYYIWLLNIGGTLLSLLIFVFLIVDDYDEQVCVDDVHYYKRAPFCLTQAFLSVGLYVWMLLWQACIAANLWITVVLQVKGEKLKAIQQKYLPICVVCSLVAPITAVSAGNLGYDWPGFTGPMCLFLFSEEEGYYWALFFTPIVLIVVTSLVLMSHSIVYVNKVLSLQKGSVSLGKGLKRFLKLVKYNRKMFQFMLCFCLIGGYQCGQILYSNRFDDSGIAKSTADYVECLFEHTTTDIWSGIRACGEHPEHRTPIWQVVLLATYYATIGICSFLVYGTQGKVRKLIKSGIQSFQTTFRSGTGDKSGDSSTSRRDGTSYSDASDARSIAASPRANSFRWQFRKSPRNTTPRAAAATAELEGDADAQL